MLVQNNISTVFDDPVEVDVLTFGQFTLDMGRGVLMHAGIDIPLRPKSFDVLTHLVVHHNRLVSRKELMETVWPDVIVTDDSLTQCLIEIRKALGDDQRTIVRTVPRRGYLFDMPVSAPEMTESTQAAPLRHEWRRPSRWTLFALAVLAIAIGATWLRVGLLPAHSVSEPVGARPADETAIAVLPFTDLSEQGDQAYLADGISEEILNLLTRVPGLTVIARTSSFSIRDQDLDVVSIARRLNVTHVLVGSVRKSGDQVRVTVHLVDGESGVDLWSQTFDNLLDDVFAMQSLIALAVKDVLNSSLLATAPYADPGQASIPHSGNPEAWILYLRGKYFYGRRSPGDIPRAQRNFEQALALDPNLAAAWIGLAGALNLCAVSGELPEEEKLSFSEILPLMKFAIGKTLELDPRNAEALIRRSSLEYSAGNEAAGYDYFNQAMRYGRNSALVHGIFAGIAFHSSDLDTAVKLARRVVRLDPLSYNAASNLAYYLYLAGQLDESKALYHRALEINPTPVYESNALFRVSISILQHDHTTAETLAKLLPAGGARDQVWSMLHYLAGNYGESDAALERLKQHDDVESRLGMVYVYAFRGETDNAFQALEALTDTLAGMRDTDEARSWFMELRTSGFLQPMHTDSRWLAWEQQTEQLLLDPTLVELSKLLQQYAATDWPVQGRVSR